MYVSMCVCMYMCKYVCMYDVLMHICRYLRVQDCVLYTFDTSVVFCSLRYHNRSLGYFVVQFTIPPRNARSSSLLVPEHWRLR